MVMIGCHGSECGSQTSLLIQIFLRFAPEGKNSLCDAKPYAQDGKQIFDEKKL